jgi:hypothetical protein
VRAPRAAGVAGLLFSVLFFGTIVLLRLHPAKNATAAEIHAFYRGGNGRYVTLIGFYLAPFAGIAFLWFAAVLRDHLVHRMDRFFDTVFVASAVLLVAMIFAGAASAGTLAAMVKFEGARLPSPGAVQFAHGLANSFVFVFAIKMAAVFMMVSSTIGFRTGGLSRWLVYATWALAAFLLVSVAYYELVVLVFPVWVALVSLLILFRGLPGDG